MRRSVFYMGRTFSQRHLTAVRSPLLTGFVNPISTSQTRSSLINSPLMCASGAICCPSVAALMSALPEDLSIRLQADTTLALQTWLESCGSRMIATFVMHAGIVVLIRDLLSVCEYQN